MLNIAICDDDALHGRHTAAQISALDGFAAAKLSLFTSADNLIYAITEDNYAVDIAVLDIQMESMDGIELAKRINELAPECQVIFLSGHIEYASKVYDAEHVFFVLKSQSETYLKSALEKAVRRREGAKANYIVITNGANAQRIPVGQGAVFGARIAAHKGCNGGRRMLDKRCAEGACGGAGRSMLLPLP